MWRAVQVRKTGSRGADKFVKDYRGSAGRAVVSFEYLGSRARELERGATRQTPGPGRSEEARDPGDRRRGVQPPHGRRATSAARSNTIQNTADRDPTFAEKLRQADYSTEIGLLKNIRNAAKKEQYWRAAAWVLERRFPERYARRGPDVITARADHAAAGRSSADIVAEEVPGRCRKRRAQAAGGAEPQSLAANRAARSRCR